MLKRKRNKQPPQKNKSIESWSGVEICEEFTVKK